MMSITFELRRSALVFLECQAQHIDPRALDRTAGPHHQLDGLFGDKFAHAVVDAPAGKNHLGVIASGLGLVGEVAEIAPDTVPARKASPERQEVPLGAGGGQHFGSCGCETRSKAPPACRR